MEIGEFRREIYRSQQRIQSSNKSVNKGLHYNSVALNYDKVNARQDYYSSGVSKRMVEGEKLYQPRKKVEHPTKGKNIDLLV